MKLAKTMLIGILLLLLLLTGCSNSSNKVNNKPEVPQNQEEQEKVRILENTVGDLKWEGCRSFLLVEERKGNVELKGWTIYAEEGKDIEMEINCGWGMKPVPPNPVNFHFLIFVDYEQIEFTVGDSEKKVKKYEMKLESGGDNMPLEAGYRFSVTIPASNLKGTHKLMLAYEYAENAPEGIMTGTAQVYDLIVGERSNYMVPSETAEAQSILSPNPWSDIIQIDQVFNPEYIKDKTLNNETKVIKTSPGELVPVALRFCGAGENSILFLTLHGEQAELEGNKYFYYEDQRDLMFKKTYFKAPEEKGEYVLTGYYVTNPYIVAASGSSNGVWMTKKLKLVVE